MTIKNWKKEIWSIPNLLSLFRLVLIPVYILIYLNATEPAHYFIAGGILAISCLTDLIDGKIARHFHMITPVGKLLDPIADKLTQLVLTISLSLRYPMMRTVLVLFLVKEVFQSVAALIHYRNGKALDGALPSGKVCTAVLFSSMIILVVFPSLDLRIVGTLVSLDSLFLMITFVQYVFAFFGKNSKVQDIET